MKENKGRMGRPPLKPSQRRNSIVTLRLNDAERKQLQEDADREGLSISKFLMKCWKQIKEES